MRTPSCICVDKRKRCVNEFTWQKTLASCLIPLLVDEAGFVCTVRNCSRSLDQIDYSP